MKCLDGLCALCWALDAAKGLATVALLLEVPFDAVCAAGVEDGVWFVSGA